MKSAYSKDTLTWLRKKAMRIKGAKSVCHLYPRAYCLAKPAPLCAVFLTPWMDAEPQVRNPQYSTSHLVYEGVQDVNPGDWCALAYVCTSSSGTLHAFKLGANTRPTAEQSI